MSYNRILIESILLGILITGLCIFIFAVELFPYNLIGILGYMMVGCIANEMFK